jgi:NitT/TauT family transport system ATP-binding protein
MTCKLSVRDVTVRFKLPGGDSLAALGPLSLDIASGQFVSIVGPSGCGKSTLIRVIAGLLPATSGEVLKDGAPVTEPSARIGMMFQQANLMPWRTVIDNVALPQELAGIDPKTRRHAARDLLRFLGLEGFDNAYPGSLSGGMAQRVALGRVLSQDPELLLLDEPFGALDAFTREQLSFDLLKLRDSKTVIMVTHDIQEAVLLSDRVIIMSARPGRIVADITVPLPRPRSPDDVFEPAFLETVRRVRRAMQSRH